MDKGVEKTIIIVSSIIIPAIALIISYLQFKDQREKTAIEEEKTEVQWANYYDQSPSLPQ